MVMSVEEREPIVRHGYRAGVVGEPKDDCPFTGKEMRRVWEAAWAMGDTARREGASVWRLH